MGVKSNGAPGVLALAPGAMPATARGAAVATDPPVARREPWAGRPAGFSERYRLSVSGQRNGTSAPYQVFIT